MPYPPSLAALAWPALLSRVLIVCMPLVLLAACEHPRVAGRSCPLKVQQVEVPLPGEPAMATAAGRPSSEFGRALSETLAEPPSGRTAGKRAAPELLVLSGGGQWGSFGAGFLHAWPQRPQFRVVTGVSTGALQSTLALLADQPVDLNRRYPEELDFPKVTGNEGRTYADDLPLAYSITRSTTIYKTHGGALNAVRKGSFGTLEPLRRRLDVILDDETFRRVGIADRLGRKLWVALLDMDAGAAVAVDMTDLAARAHLPGAPTEEYRQCYLDVLMAAASEPLGTEPIFINGRMYMDAGVRYGVFLEEVTKAATAGAANVTVIVNGDLTVPDVTTKPGEKPEPWSLLTIAKRSMEIVSDQVYDFSVARVIAHGQSLGGVRLARIGADHEQHVFEGKTCKQAMEADVAAEQGDEFQPQYMRCLIDYGAKRGREQSWNLNVPLRQ